VKETSDNALPESDRSAGVPPAGAGASRPGYREVTIRNRGRLPHWEKEGATYFITFRLADSLPKSVLDRIESERHAIITTAKQLHRELSPDERKKIQALSTPVIERFLDNGVGACHLRNPVIAEDLANILRHFDRMRYSLFAWCIMPNHVHILARLLPGAQLANVVHSWKSFSAKRANRILGSHGTFWQREYYDHMIRSDEDFERALQYIAENPEKANLKYWKWIWVRGRDARAAWPELTEGTAAEDGGATKSTGL
jgi:REP element-mobilizing transposase RayT